MNAWFSVCIVSCFRRAGEARLSLLMPLRVIVDASSSHAYIPLHLSSSRRRCKLQAASCKLRAVRVCVCFVASSCSSVRPAVAYCWCRLLVTQHYDLSVPCFGRMENLKTKVFFIVTRGFPFASPAMGDHADHGGPWGLWGTMGTMGDHGDHGGPWGPWGSMGDQPWRPWGTMGTMGDHGDHGDNGRPWGCPCVCVSVSLRLRVVLSGQPWRIVGVVCL